MVRLFEDMTVEQLKTELYQRNTKLSDKKGILQSYFLACAAATKARLPAWQRTGNDRDGRAGEWQASRQNLGGRRC